MVIIHRQIMRVVGGVAKGRRLRGSKVLGARPTSGLVRGAIFNVLSPLDLRSISVLDLYAGTGSLGIEALSRGASRADFVEHHPRQCAVISSNLAATGFNEIAEVYCMDADKALTVLEGHYQLILMDPPYKLATLPDVLHRLAASRILDEHATIVVGHSNRLSLQGTYGDLKPLGHYRYGDSAVDFFERGDR